MSEGGDVPVSETGDISVNAKEALQQSKVFLQLAEGARDEVSLETCIKYAQVHALQSIAQSLINYLDPPF